MNCDRSYQPNELDSRLERFDHCWNCGEAPAIEDFLPPTGSQVLDDAERKQLLVELVLIDLEYRWERCPIEDSDSTTCDSGGQAASECVLPDRPRIEDYVRCYPDLGPWDQLPVTLITEEYRVRWSCGDTPEIDTYFQRFPRRAERLRVELPRVKRQLHAPESSSGVHIRCPHCHGSVVLAHADLSDVCCPSCGSHFSLLGHPTRPTDGRVEVRYLGHIELLEQIGTGGFGVVWKARDHELHRVIAVKIPRHGQLAPDQVEQFLREARAAAQLRHPNIVPVYQVGREDNTVYIASEYVEGHTLDVLIGDHRLTIRESTELCAKVAEALHHAHDSGVVHRDLKPSNIMVDSDGQPHIMDFGLARREAGEVTVTLEGKVLGTPAYMSPEQAKGRAHQADRRSDVYSLGVILFELLTSDRPFRGNVRMLLHHVIHDDPPSPRRLNSGIHRDLETICLKCLQKDPRKRYGTGRELAVELRRFLRGEPIQARPMSRTGRAWRWCQRYPVAAALVAILLLVAILGPLAAVNQARLAAREATQREKNRRQLYVADMVVAQRAWEAANVGRVRQLLARHEPGPQQVDLRGFQWYHLWELCRRGWTVPTLGEHQGSIWSLAFSPDGQTLASGSISGEIVIWDVRARKPRCTLRVQAGSVSLAIAPDGQTLAAASSETDGGWLEIWDLPRGELKSQLHLEQPAPYLAISQDGNFLAWGNANGTISLGDYHQLSAENTVTFEGNHDAWITSLAFSPDGNTLVSSSVDYTINVWDVPKRMLRTRLTGHESWVRGIAISPNGELIASASFDKTVRLWDLHTGQLKTTLEGHRSHLWSVAFSPDSKTVVSASSDGTVRLWDVVLGVEKDRLIGHENPTVLSVAYSPDGGTVASAGADATIRLWDVTEIGSRDALLGHDQAVFSVTISPDDSTLASASADTTIKLWDLSTGSLLSTLPGHANWVICLDFSHDGTLLASAGHDGIIKVWDMDTDEESGTPLSGQGMAPFWSVAFSPDDKTLAAGDHSGIVTLWDLKTRSLRQRLEGHHSIVWPVTFSPDGKTLASGGWVDRTVRLWDAATGASKDVLQGHSASVFCLAFSRDGRTLASGSEDTTIKLWDVATGEERQTLQGHAGEVMSVSFYPFPDGEALASGSSDGTIKLWYLGRDREPETLTGHQSGVNSLVFSSDGLVLASAGEDNTLRLWRRASKHVVQSTRWLPSLGRGHR